MKNPDKEKYNAVAAKGNASPSCSRWGKGGRGQGGEGGGIRRKRREGGRAC
jgi:hypothetical protein